MQKLSDIILSEGITTNRKNSAILKTKFDLGEICYKKVCQYLEKKDKNIAKVYSKTYQIHSEIINDYERLYSTLAEGYYQQKDQNAELQAKVNHLTANLEKANMEKAAVLDIGENMEKQVNQKLEENKRIEEEYKEKIKELEGRLEEVSEENKHIFGKLIDHAKTRADKILEKGIGKRNQEAVKEGEGKLDAFKLFNVGSAKRNEQIGNTSIRTMTLKQLKDTINEIYENKEKHDEKCRRTRLPLETMEQFMFTHLNQKYGLKNLIIEWAASIVNGVKLYMKEDFDVALFAKLLKNEVEEDFRYIQDKIKTTVSKVLRKHLREKFKHKGEQELSEIQNSMEKSYIPLQA